MSNGAATAVQTAAPPLPVYPPKPLLLPDGRSAYPVAPLASGVRPVAAAATALPAGERPASMTLLHVWILLFGFVGTQLA
ncbi:hypothetical protein AB0K00_41195 [Dactylosporangium sp. NPDC049525]|uniref:hypothetical protein n=1 Tax=Dactylosporangium sp. NPDC049525 TaxID=3154730 RepID=UPI00342846B0